MTTAPALPLDNLPFENTFVSALPGDASQATTTRQVLGAAYSTVQPSTTSDPRLVAVASDVAELLGIDAPQYESEDFVRVMSGNRVPSGTVPFAMNYGGHQFGHWAGQLGDGRAITIGEMADRDGTLQQIQLKGAGPTPYSRHADGLAVLRSSVREFLCSEAMHHLGVPTTRALSLATTGDRVLRDMFYDGNPEYEAGAVVARVAPSFLRFGSYQLFASRGDLETLAALGAHTLERHFPHLGEPSPEAYAQMYREVVDRTVDLVVHWTRVGFVHGVMNTDNMSILGLTIDYGPYGWLEDFDPDWTPNTTDAQHRRYRFGNQPGIAQWNLMQLANALYPLIEEVEPLQEALDGFVAMFEERHQAMATAKLGLSRYADGDDDLLRELSALLQLAEADMTLFYRTLSDVDAVQLSQDTGRDDQALVRPLLPTLYRELSADEVARFAAWLRTYADRLGRDRVEPSLRRERMRAVNPKYVLRNYLAQLAIDALNAGDPAKLHELSRALEHPYDDQPEFEHLAAKRPEWARQRPGCSMLSCSS